MTKPRKSDPKHVADADRLLAETADERREIAEREGLPVDDRERRQHGPTHGSKR